MEYEALMALIEDGGGFDNVVRLVFDNSIHINFCKSPEETKLKKTDFVKFGGQWFYKELFVGRSIDTYEYDIKLTNYHPLECLQSVIMSSESDKLDIISMNDMLSQFT